MITANVIHRVFRISFNGSEGTAFAIEIDAHEYLVTAKHILATLAGDGHVQIFSNGSWLDHPVQLVGHAAEDISVFTLGSALVPAGLTLEATAAHLAYGQDVYFLGFPYGFLGKYIFGPSGYPLPFVKKAIVSLFDGPTIFLDGHNNPGFSGGPVVFRVSPTDFRVAAVISGFKAVAEPIYAGTQPTSFISKYNTGIVVSYNIHAAVVLARSNPIGPKCAA